MGSSRTIVRLVLCLALFAFVLSIASTSEATSIPVRTGSSYGPLSSDFGTCVNDILLFLNTGTQNTCEQDIAGTFTIGSNAYNGNEFAFLGGDGSFGILDVIQLNALGSLTLPLANIALPTGIFVCGSGGDGADTSVAHDSSFPSQPLNDLVCTTGNTTTDFTGQIGANFTLQGVTFTNNGDSPVAVFTADGNIVGATFTPGTTVVSTPEPASLMLLGAGIAALFGFRRRKQ